MTINVLPRADYEDIVRRALAEDVGLGDRTTAATVKAGQLAHGRFVAKDSLVVAGLDVAAETFRQLDPSLVIEVNWGDGSHVEAGDVIAVVSGNARAMLTAERTALNFLQRLSGIATMTREYVAAMGDAPCVLLDTRKTIPGLRHLEKYATRMGGAQNHRLGLWDAAMIKDNHVLVAGGVAEAVRRARAAGIARIICEVDRLEQIEPAIAAGANHVLLDNMDPATLREAVALVGGRAATEASGGVRLDTIGAIAASGVDFVSVGRLTQSAPAADIGLDFTPL